MKIKFLRPEVCRDIGAITVVWLVWFLVWLLFLIGLPNSFWFCFLPIHIMIYCVYVCLILRPKRVL